MVTNYMIIVNTDIHSFVSEVQNYIKLGWQPYGNLYVVYEGYSGEEKAKYHQPMVRYIKSSTMPAKEIEIEIESEIIPNEFEKTSG